MKTVILCGGIGTRLKEETEYKPKPLVNIGGRPILWHIMKIYSHQGFRDFILCLGYKGNMIKDYFLNIREMSNNFVLDLKNKEKMSLNEEEELDAKISFINTDDPGVINLTGSRVAKIKKYIGEDEDFFLAYGDDLSDVDLKKLYEVHKKSGAILTITAINPINPFGVLDIDKNGKVVNFVEKPLMKEFINGGYMVCNRKIFDYLSEDSNCIFEQTPMKKLAKEGKLAVYYHKGFWRAMNDQKQLDELNDIYKKGAPWEIWKNNKEVITKKNG